MCLGLIDKHILNFNNYDYMNFEFNVNTVIKKYHRIEHVNEDKSDHKSLPGILLRKKPIDIYKRNETLH